MGYHLTILRTLQGKQVPVSLEEVKDAALTLGEWQFKESPPIFELHGKDGFCTLWYQDGELWAKTPEPWELEPMLALAKQLNARVRGDEFETYESVEKTFFHPDDLQLRKDAEAGSMALVARSIREQKLIRNAIVAFFVLLAIAGYFIGKWFEKP